MLTAIIQARMTSTRLPGKVLADIGGRPLLQRMLDRVRRSARIEKLVVATTTNATDDPVEHLCDSLNVGIFRGSEHDVLARFHGAAEAAGASTVVRLTADCPMNDPMIIDQVIARYLRGDCDYASNAVARTYPDGLDVEVFSRAALDEAHRQAKHPYMREHVTPYIYGCQYGGGNFRLAAVCFDADLAHLRWTVDTPADLARVRELFRALPENFTWLEALSLATRRPELLGVPA